MNYEVVELEEKILMGLSARTGNSDPKMGEIIGGLWKDFYQQEILEQFTAKASDYAIGLYSDYEEDRYDVTVGYMVNAKTSETLVTKRIPAGKYAKFSLKGDMIKVVADAWGEIWQMDLPRTYTGDFEEYCNGDPQNCEIHIYIAIQ